MTPDDDLESRLRDVLHSRGLSIRPDDDALERIHAGARRRQRRRAVASSVAAVAAMGIVAAGITLAPGRHGGTPVAGGSASTSSASTTHALSSTPSGKVPSTSPTPAVSSTLTIPPAATLPAGGTPPNGFTPLSVTAVNANTYWVLGHAPCGSTVCVGVAKTTDGGKTFTEVGAPANVLVPDVPGNKDVFGTDTIANIRFGNGSDGWAYGGGLWATTDGGAHWSQLHIDGAVEQLAAANGHAWAIVNTGDGPKYQLYTAKYPDGSWAKVDSVGDFGPAEPALAVQGTAVTVIGVDATSGAARVLRSTDAANFETLPGPPCQPAAGDPVSTTSKGLWLACTSSGKNLGGVYFSSDFGKSWQVAASSLAAEQVAIGAVDTRSAIVTDGGKIVRAGADGSVAPVKLPPGVTAQGWSFIGFTTSSDGFAVAVSNGTRQLWRTTDGGTTWSVVAIGS
jgi:hypothetical protein